jgi:hypothetical protein
VSFLNIALIGGVAAFLVPLAIHLLNRSRHQSIDWGAMHLLEAALQVNSRRFQWESILLLFLRCLIPILFAIGLARPVLTSLKSSAAQGEASMVVMLDNSLSMQATDTLQPDQSRFQRAVYETRQLLSQQQRADLSVWSSGGGPINLVNGSTFDSGLALRSLAKIKPGAGPSDPIGLIDAGIAQLTGMANPNKQLVIVSDFQTSQWGDLAVEQIQQLKALLDSASVPIQLSLMAIAGGDADEPQHNLSVELSPECREGQLEPTFVNDPLRVTATIHNWGNRQVSNTRVVFRVDDQALASESLDLQPHSKQQVQFGCSFKTPGKHTYSVQLDVPGEKTDELSSDDKATGVIFVHETIQIVIVDPASANNEEFCVGKFLQLAISPEADRTSFQVQLLSHMPPADDLRACHVLAIVGSNFDDNIAKQVADFVQRGGGLLLVPADNMDYGRINRLWFEQTRLLPARYLQHKSNSAEPLQLKQQLFQDNVLSIFNSGEHGDLSSVQSQKWHALELESSAVSPAVSADSSGLQSQARADSASSALLMLEDDTIVMAKRSIGLGAVIQLGLSPSPQWSNLSARPVFVPLMQRLVIDLVGEGIQLPHQLLTGQSLSLTMHQFQAAVGNSNSKTKSPSVTKAWSLIDPNGDQVEFLVSNASDDQPAASDQQSHSAGLPSISLPSISLPTLRWPGVYRLLSADDTMSKVEDAPVSLAAAVPGGESDLRLLDKSQLEQLSENLGATIAYSANDYQTVQQVRRDGKEIWRPLLVMLLVFLFAEILLARRVTRGV